MISKAKIRIGTRSSKLAITQAELVKQKIIESTSFNKDDITLVLIQTKGDLITDRPLSYIGGKSLFIKEIEEALLKKEIDIAVHSLKDFTSKIPEELTIRAYLKRADYRDALVSLNNYSILTLPKNAIVGTSSCRRVAQLQEIRDDLKIIPLRGNILTRMSKIGTEVDAAILAVAGLQRISIDKNLYTPIETSQMLPAPGQGSICVQCRKDNIEMLAICDLINDQETFLTSLAERGYGEALEADCNIPLAALAQVFGDNISIECHLYSKNSKNKYIEKGFANIKNSYNLGYKIGQKLKKYLE